MQEIKKNKSTIEIEAIDAVIENNTIIPGINGKTVDINKSYKKMKKVKKYLESLIVTNEIPPTISIKNQYDKLVISGNKKNKKISILLKITDLNLLKTINNNSLSYILDINFIEENQIFMKRIKNNIVVLEQKNLKNLNYFDYCFTEKSFHSYCSSYKKYTIKPILITHDYYYNTLNKLENGLIFSYNINSAKNIEEINIIISSIRNLGYQIVSIEELLEE